MRLLCPLSRAQGKSHQRDSWAAPVLTGFLSLLACAHAPATGERGQGFGRVLSSAGPHGCYIGPCIGDITFRVHSLGKARSECPCRQDQVPSSPAQAHSFLLPLFYPFEMPGLHRLAPPPLCLEVRQDLRKGSKLSLHFLPAPRWGW